MDPIECRETNENWTPAEIRLAGCEYSPLRVFADEHKARLHIEKHLLGPDEAVAWSLVLPTLSTTVGDLANACVRHRVFCQQQRDPALRAQLYDAYVTAIESELRAACRVGWVKVVERRDGWVGVALGLCGLLIVAEDGTIVTAFLPGQPPEPWSGASLLRGRTQRRYRVRAGADLQRQRRRERAWSQEERLYYRVFRPAVQFVRRAQYERFRSHWVLRPRKNIYAMLKDLLPSTRSISFTRWQQLRQGRPKDAPDRCVSVLQCLP